MPGKLPDAYSFDQKPDEATFVFRRQFDFIADQMRIDGVADKVGKQPEICIE